MTLVVPVREDRLLVLSTFVAALGPSLPRREYYLSLDTERLLEGVLVALSGGDRETMRAIGYALHTAFTRRFPLGLLEEIRSYRQDRCIRFEQAKTRLTRLAVLKHSTNKEIVLLGIPATYLLEDTAPQFSLPLYPFSFRPHHG